VDRGRGGMHVDCMREVLWHWRRCVGVLVGMHASWRARWVDACSSMGRGRACQHIDTHLFRYA